MAKDKENQEAAANEAAPKRKYNVVGLKEADSMPILLHGRRFDLANLSDPELEYLLENKYPHVQKV